MRSKADFLIVLFTSGHCTTDSSLRNRPSGCRDCGAECGSCCEGPLQARALVQGPAHAFIVVIGEVVGYELRVGHRPAGFHRARDRGAVGRLKMAARGRDYNRAPVASPDPPCDGEARPG